MSRVISLYLSFILLFSGSTLDKNNAEFSHNNNAKISSFTLGEESRFQHQGDFEELNDKKLLHYLETQVYENLVATLDSDDYFIENVQAIYKSKEYLDEVEYNSKENIYFGFTISDLEKMYKGEKYIFTTDDSGKTIVKRFESKEAVFDDVLTNVLIGTGTIVLCITVSSIASTSAPALSIILAASAKSGATIALSNGVLSGVAAGIVKGIETGDFENAVAEAVNVGSEAFKWGAVTGVLAGGTMSAIGLRGASFNGLTMNEAAAIQRDSKYPLDVIKGFNTTEQYGITKNAGLYTKMVNKKNALIRNIDLKRIDPNGLTNLERMRQGLPALDPTGKPYELHHIGRKINSTLAILTKEEHMMNGNNKIWHLIDALTENPSMQIDWARRRMSFWKGLAMLYS